MALTNIEYGSVASSEVVNNNFQYLDDKISSVSQSLNTNVTTLSGSISSLSAIVSSNNEAANAANEELQKNIDNVVTDIEEIKTTIGAAYVKESYCSGQNWYRLYSDGWCEQGGYVAMNSTSKNVTLFKKLANTNASVYVSCIKSYTNGNWDIGIAGAKIASTTTITITAGRDNGGGGVYWRVCGMIKQEDN